MLEADQDTTLLLATHNHDSIAKCVDLLKNIPTTRCNVQFVQLFGMHDLITSTLAQRGYNVAKCVPVGTVNQAIPYLLRRAKENSSVLNGNSIDTRLLWYTLTHRIQKTMFA